VVKVKYGVNDLSWWTKKSFYSHRVNCWKSVSADFERFKSLVHLEVKDGSV